MNILGLKTGKPKMYPITLIDITELFGIIIRKNDKNVQIILR